MKNTMAKRKVREDFNPEIEYGVNVEGCTEDVKKVVQQAFFDAGFSWMMGGKEYQHLDAVQYTNTTECGNITTLLMYGTSTHDCNMTAQEFLDLVYESEQRGHIHAELMAQYAEDAKTHDEPWRLWQVNYGVNFEEGEWVKLRDNPTWGTGVKYRRKPKTKLIHGVEIPTFEFKPKIGEKYYVANVGLPELFENGHRPSEDCTFTQRMFERGLIYPYTEEGKQAAILHAKAMLGIA